MGIKRGNKLRYILNSAVITSPGRYEYKPISMEGVKVFLGEPGWISNIGYKETEQALSLLKGTHIPVNGGVQ
jgi:hypothetical protein